MCDNTPLNLDPPNKNPHLGPHSFHSYLGPRQRFPHSSHQFPLPHPATPEVVQGSTNTRLYKFTQGSQVTDALYYEQFKSLVKVIEHYQGEIGHHPKLILQELEVLVETNQDSDTNLC